MCGRFGVDENLSKKIKQQLGVDFQYAQNMDIKPTNTVATLINENGVLTQKNATWGIKPAWANRLLINAKAETASEKPTFSESFYRYRCIIPISCWYEWKNENKQTEIITSSKGKIKYQFFRANAEPLYMAGIHFITESRPQLVTLTTSPNKICAQYHNRMPLLISESNIEHWLNSSEYAEYISQSQFLHKDDIFEIKPAM